MNLKSLKTPPLNTIKSTLNKYIINKNNFKNIIYTDKLEHNIQHIFSKFNNNLLNFEGTYLKSDLKYFNYLLNHSVIFKNPNQFYNIFLYKKDFILNNKNNIFFKIPLNYDLYIFPLIIYKHNNYHSVMIIYDNFLNELHYFDPLSNDDLSHIPSHFNNFVNNLKHHFSINNINIIIHYSIIQKTYNLKLLKLKYTSSNNFCSIWCIFFVECFLYYKPLVSNITKIKHQLYFNNVDPFFISIIHNIIKTPHLFPLIYLGYFSNTLIYN